MEMAIDTSNILISSVLLTVFIFVFSYFINKYISERYKKSAAYIRDFLIKNKNLSFTQAAKVLNVPKWKVFNVAKKYKIKSKYKFGGKQLE